MRSVVRFSFVAIGWLVGAGISLQPQTAWATCGDYLQMDGHHGTATNHRSPDGRDAAPVPCRGEGCRRSAPPVVPPAPPSSERTSDQWAYVIRRQDSPLLPGRSQQTGL